MTGFAVTGQREIFSRFTAEWIDDGRPWERADVQPIMAIVVASVSALAELDYVISIVRSSPTCEWVLHGQPGVVHVCKRHPIGIQHREPSVKVGAAQADSFCFGRKGLSLFCFNEKAIHVLAGDDTRHSGIEGDFLGVRAFVVRFGFGNNRKRSNEESA